MNIKNAQRQWVRDEFSTLNKLIRDAIFERKEALHVDTLTEREESYLRLEGFQVDRYDGNTSATIAGWAKPETT